MSLRAEIDDLRSELERQLGDVLRAAEVASMDARWSVVQHHWLGATDVVLATNGRSARGDRVRAVLETMAGAFDRAAGELEQRARARGGDGDDDVLWQFRHRRLSQLAETETAAYLSRIAPPPGLAGVFARAAVRADRYAPPISAAGGSVDTVQCAGCGAPRIGDAEQRICRFCGNELFKPEAP